MAVNLLGATNARIDFGDIAGIAGLTAITISITFLASSIVNDERIVSQWGATSSEECFIIAFTNDELLFFIIDSGDTIFKGRQTTGTNFVAGSLYRVVCRWRASDGSMEIWVNGVSQSVATFVSDGVVAALNDASTAVQVGHETAEGTDGIDADYAEFAIHSVYMPDDYCIAYGKGFSPSFRKVNGLLYAPMINVNNLKDYWGGVTGTNTNGTSAGHPGIIRPLGQRAISISLGAQPQASLIAPHTTIVYSQRMIPY